MKLRTTIAAAVVSLAAAAPAAASPVDDQNSCREALPSAAPSLSTAPLDLNVLVLLDGVSQTDAAKAVKAAAGAYKPLGIRLVATYQTVDLPGTTADALLSQSKALVGGKRPAGTDAVLTFTSLTLPYDPLGQADCIGGIRDPARAFAVADTISYHSEHLSRFKLFPVEHGILLAHQLGHLLGAQHAHANCAQGQAAPSDPTDIPVTPCTVMFPDQGMWSPRFGLLDGAVVRGYAEAFA